MKLSIRTPHTFHRLFLGVSVSIAAAALLSACGGGDNGPDDMGASVNTLLTTEQGMGGVTTHGNATFVPLHASPRSGTAVLRATGSLGNATTWQRVNLGNCGLRSVNGNEPWRVPTIRHAMSTTWLLQDPQLDSRSNPEYALCALNENTLTFRVADEGPRSSDLWANDLRAVGNRLLANFGSGPNLMVSDDKGRNWRSLLGSGRASNCAHQAFHAYGNRVLVGGECLLENAAMTSYPLVFDGKPLDPKSRQPIRLPQMDNRTVHHITSVPGTQRVYASADGALLRSTDGGESFHYVIRKSPGDSLYPQITSVLSPIGQPRRLLIAGYDKAQVRAFLAWSDNAGDSWVDLSHLLPGYRAPADKNRGVMVTGLAEASNGRIYVSMNEAQESRGRLMELKLWTFKSAEAQVLTPEPEPPAASPAQSAPEHQTASQPIA